MYKDTIFSLENKVAIITGGSKGIGKAIASIYAQAGADLVLTARNEDELIATSQEIIKLTGRKVYPFVFDHVHWKESDELLRKIIQTVNHIDILVNNVGTGMVKNIEETTDSAWLEMSHLILSTTMAMCRSTLPYMKENHSGRIINISSILGNVGREKRTAYGCFKGAILSFTKSLALECMQYGININAISPGQFLTPLTTGMWNDEQKYKAVTELIPMNRWGKVNEIQGTALLLASDACSYITGQNILVDGGWSIW